MELCFLIEIFLSATVLKRVFIISIIIIIQTSIFILIIPSLLFFKQIHMAFISRSSWIGAEIFFSRSLIVCHYIGAQREICDHSINLLYVRFRQSRTAVDDFR